MRLLLFGTTILGFALPLVGAWAVQPAGSPANIAAAAGLCIDEFEKLPLPLLPLPGWEERARTEAIAQWAQSREELLKGSAQHALLVAQRNEQEAGRFFEGVDDGMLGFVELGLLPPPPEKTAEGEDDGAYENGADVTDGAKRRAASPEGAEPSQYPYVANLAVKAGARGLGLGKDLVLASERVAAEWGYDRMYIKVDRQNFIA